MNTDDAHTMKGTTVRLKPYDVLHIPGLGFDGLVGYSPIAMAKNAIGMAIACEEYGAKFIANGAAPSDVLEHPGTIKDPSRVRESWQEPLVVLLMLTRWRYWKNIYCICHSMFGRYIIISKQMMRTF